MKYSIINNMSMSEVDRRVQIAGTKFDRRVKVTDKMDAGMKRMFANGCSLQAIATFYNVGVTTVRRHVDRKYYESHIHDGGHTTPKMSWKERAEYKRALLLRGCKVTVIDK